MKGQSDALLRYLRVPAAAGVSDQRFNFFARHLVVAHVPVERELYAVVTVVQRLRFQNIDVLNHDTFGIIVCNERIWAIAILEDALSWAKRN